MQIDHAVTADEIVLLKEATPQSYRAWHMDLIGGFIDNDLRLRWPSPEEELKTLLDRMQPGDRLWLARSKRYEPHVLIGNVGVAVVRDGVPLWYRIAWQH
ncbi:hypothetical protein [Rhizobium sp. SL42]|uniref:hypothetical protein n=1 Tax=Rhizobium sp. SL42 TaxID=2806346 RepID=UPI001F3CE14A|nr:hypothetical protein [Rhizobium sp. SL42]UJW73371.1 hypothetical protein IM739_10545 [Rhizobium sp. SL42]